jgi:hypothetical protein
MTWHEICRLPVEEKLHMTTPDVLPNLLLPALLGSLSRKFYSEHVIS